MSDLIAILAEKFKALDALYDAEGDPDYKRGVRDDDVDAACHEVLEAARAVASASVTKALPPQNSGEVIFN